MAARGQQVARAAGAGGVVTDRWRGVFVAGAFGVVLVLLLHVGTGCGGGDRAPTADAAQDAAATHEDASGTMDSGGGSDAPGMDAGGLSDAPPPPDASLPDGATAD